MLPINDRQKHMVLYTWELYDAVVNFAEAKTSNTPRVSIEKHMENAVTSVKTCFLIKLPNPLALLVKKFSEYRYISTVMLSQHLFLIPKSEVTGQPRTKIELEHVNAIALITTRMFY